MNQFQTLKSDLTKSRIINEDLPTISNGEILLKIESFAFTANNVTYGVAGDTIGYWKFFPAAQDSDNSWGCLLYTSPSPRDKRQSRMPSSA